MDSTEEKPHGNQYFRTKKLDNQRENMIGEKYERPKITYTDTLSKREILDYLQDFERVDDIDKTTIGSYISYIDISGEYPIFRLGGTIMVNKPDYLVLNGGKASFSVQKKNKLFFRRLNHTELKKEMEVHVQKCIQLLHERDQRINELNLYIRDLKNKLHERDQRLNELNLYIRDSKKKLHEA